MGLMSPVAAQLCGDRGDEQDAARGVEPGGEEGGDVGGVEDEVVVDVGQAVAGFDEDGDGADPGGWGAAIGGLTLAI